ncbi:hypothetical protein [Micromonospora sp. NPDC049679]|uniref:hypothetical protein n=1 Tax=Micromonospora sp. NPDC049679 TaxID=3155920 RepID=UPI0033DEC2D8
MGRKAAVALGALLTVAGFVLALVGLAVPWVNYRIRVDATTGDSGVERAAGVAVFQLDHGWWYVIALFVLLGCVAGAAAGSGRAARVSAVAGIAVGVLAMLVASAIGAQIAATSADAFGLTTIQVAAVRSAGSTYGVAAPPLLALGAALLSVRTAQHRPPAS